MINRKEFIAGLIASQILSSCLSNKNSALFKISLAQWSLHRALQKGHIKAKDFPQVTQKEFGISGLEYVNGFYTEQKHQASFWKNLKKQADSEGCQSVLIMCDREGLLGDPDQKRRKEAVENHLAWLENAKILGCHAIRVNAKSHKKLASNEQRELCVDGLGQLAQKAKAMDMNIVIENHGGLSANGAWLANTLAEVGMDNCGSLPDFGNFKKYDRYQGIRDLMPFAKGVSAKTHDFNAQGDEIHTDYKKAMKIVLAHGYKSWVGIEYEGKGDEYEGIRKSKALLEKIRLALA